MASTDPDTLAAIAVTRFGLGARPGELAAARPDPKAWLKRQIRRSGADQPEANLPGSAARIIAYRQHQQDRRMARADDASDQSQPVQAVTSLIQASGLQDEILARAQVGCTTDAGFRERWTVFWSNHFTVSAVKAQTLAAAGPFEREAIRPHVFGRFEDMLIAAARHPGMLIYLDQAQSVGPNSLAARRRGPDAGLNENLAREILELHTVGVDGGYSQADVTEFARALTGWTVGAAADGDRAGRYLFRTRMHEPGLRTVMGRRYADGGETAALAILKDLAAHPATARHVSRKLAAHFVADEPPAGLVEALEQAFVNSGGQLGAVASALIDAEESWAEPAAKFKTPYELVISAHRALGVSPSRPLQIVQPLNALGQQSFRAPSPKGWPDEAAAWASPDALIKRLAWTEDFAAQVSSGPRPPFQVAKDCLGARLRDETASAIIGAESRSEALAILFMSPEFQRR